MKNFMAVVILMASTTMLYGQGTIWISTAGNNDASSTATSNGQYWMPGPISPVLMDYTVNNSWTHLNINLFAGPNAGSLTLIYSSIGADLVNATYGYVTHADPGTGTFHDLTESIYSIPNVPLSGTAYMRQQVWFGSAPDWATAVLTTPFRAQTDWLNPTGGGGEPAALPPSLSGMPATFVGVIPEPGTLSLMGLGLAWFVTVRRRK